MNSLAINSNSNAVFEDGSCIYTALSSSSSTLSLEVGVAMTPHTLTYSTPFLEDDKQTAASSGAVGRDQTSPSIPTEPSTFVQRP